MGKDYGWGKKVKSKPNKARARGRSIPVMTIVMAVIYIAIFIAIFVFLNQVIGQPLVIFAWLWGFDQEWVFFGMLGISVILVFIIFIVVSNATRGKPRGR